MSLHSTTLTGAASASATPAAPALHKGLHSLLIEYGALVSQATHSSALFSEAGLKPLADRLRTPTSMILDALNSIGEEAREALWAQVIERRIRHAAASGVFVAANWEQLEAGTVAQLLRLVERGLIKDPSELLAISRVANQINRGPTSPGPGAGTHGQNTTIQFFSGQPVEGPVPGADSPVMRIDLSPRTASALMRKPPVDQDEGRTRVIDHERVDAEELRHIAAERKANPESQYDAFDRRMREVEEDDFSKLDF